MRLNNSIDLESGIATACREGDKITFLVLRISNFIIFTVYFNFTSFLILMFILLQHGAGKTFQDTFAGDLEYIIRKQDNMMVDDEVTEVDRVFSSPTKRKRKSTVPSSLTTYDMSADDINGGGVPGKDTVTMTKEMSSNNSTQAADTMSCAICMGVLIDTWTINCPSWHNFCKEVPPPPHTLFSSLRINTNIVSQCVYESVSLIG